MISYLDLNFQLYHIYKIYAEYVTCNLYLCIKPIPIISAFEILSGSPTNFGVKQLRYSTFLFYFLVVVLEFVQLVLLNDA